MTATVAGQLERHDRRRRSDGELGPALTVMETDGVTAGTNLLANDTQGADGATVTAVDISAMASRRLRRRNYTLSTATAPIRSRRMERGRSIRMQT